MNVSKEKKVEYNKSYYNKHKEKLNEYNRNRYHNNKEYRDKSLQYSKEYRVENKEYFRNHWKKNYLKKVKKIYTIEEKRFIRNERNKVLYQKWKESGKLAEWRKNYRKHINVRISSNLRSRIWQSIKRIDRNRIKEYQFNELIGCPIEFLIKYLEFLFKDGMTWGNYGRNGWHIDHIKPCSLFNLEDENEQRQCFNYTNLQPLWWRDNIIKSNKIIE